MRTMAVIAVCALAAGSAMAGNWYGAVDAGYIEQVFHASYTYAEPGHTPDKFSDHTYGVEVNMQGGYRFQLCERVSCPLKPGWEPTMRSGICSFRTSHLTSNTRARMPFS